MIRQQFSVRNYWEVIIYYDVDYDLFNHIAQELRYIGFSRQSIEELQDDMESSQAKAVTCSNLEEHISIVIFNQHKSKRDYFNSIVHEAEHIKQAMLKAYQVEDEGEPPAYTIGYLISKMYPVFKNIVCDCY